MSLPSSNHKVVAQKESTEEWRPVSPVRPVSAPGYAKQGEWIDDIRKLTIGQEGQDQSNPRQQERPLAASNKRTTPDAPTRKRGAEDEAESPDAPLGSSDTRPISHEQLVVEVKNIYAGLVMVEAKCIDIDERQSAAAQEKDPSKNIDLKNDQWESTEDLKPASRQRPISLWSYDPQVQGEQTEEAASPDLPLRSPAAQFVVTSGHRFETPFRESSPGTDQGLSKQFYKLTQLYQLAQQINADNREYRKLLDEDPYQDYDIYESLKFMNPTRSKRSIPSLVKNFGNKVAKIKRGLPGFINGNRTSALADTGTAKNVISAAFAQDKGPVLKERAAVFRLGNSGRVQSIGKMKQAVMIFAVLLSYR